MTCCPVTGVSSRVVVRPFKRFNTDSGTSDRGNVPTRPSRVEKENLRDFFRTTFSFFASSLFSREDFCIVDSPRAIRNLSLLKWFTYM